MYRLTVISEFVKFVSDVRDFGGRNSIMVEIL